MLFLNAVLILALTGAPGVSSPVVAEVNGEVITMHDVDVVVVTLFKRLEASYEGEALAKKKAEIFKQAVDRLVEQKLLVQAAKERGIKAEEEVVDSQMEALADRVGGWPTLLNMLAKVGISFEERAEQVRDGIMARKLLSSEIVPKIYASPSSVKRYYEEHHEEFTEPSEYKVCQIIVWKSRYTSAEEIKKKLAIIHGELEKDADFAEIARNHSDGPHAKNGGDWGFVGPKDLVAELSDVLRGMRIGEVKGPIETSVGLHFIKLIDAKDPTLRVFADVHDEIEGILRNQAYMLESDKYVNNLRQQGFVKIYKYAASSAE